MTLQLTSSDDGCQILPIAVHYGGHEDKEGVVDLELHFVLQPSQTLLHLRVGSGGAAHQLVPLVLQLPNPAINVKYLFQTKIQYKNDNKY